ncbi:uncharacterized protein LOC125680367 isoform X2 [Ostrea edulis]|uniref:uncharacterized protein LOC125680367 isoform X2 n=1 Tax=Ostrea edulis TaxID=37623 RepID=UPI0024AE91E8|nr:uncharacterized protein LOC125680367 isoform X2 [Ostrea edulis]
MPAERLLSVVWILGLCQCRYPENCVNMVVAENASNSFTCKERTISEKECQRRVISGFCVAPSDSALRNVQLKILKRNEREVSWNVIYDGAETGGYLIEYPVDRAWSLTLCRAIFIDSVNIFTATFKTTFHTASSLTPTVRPMWRMLNDDDNWHGAVFIDNPKGNPLKISFEVQTSKSFRYHVELRRSNGELIQNLTVDKSFAVFHDVQPGSYYAKIKILRNGTCCCSNIKRCKRCKDWTTDVFVHPSSGKTVLVASGAVILLACKIVAKRFIEGRRLEFVGKENYKVNCKDVMLFAARENKCHVNAVIKLQKYLSSVCKRRVTYTFIEQGDREQQETFAPEREALIVIILSKSLAWWLQCTEHWEEQRSNTLIYVIMAEDCGKHISNPINVTLFHLHRDIGMFHNFLSELFPHNYTKQDKTIIGKLQSLKFAVAELQKYQNNHYDSEMYREKSLLKNTLDRSFENILQMVAINKKRKYFGNSESTALPNHFEFTSGNTNDHEKRVHSHFTWNGDKGKGSTLQCKEGVAPCQTQSMVGQKSPLLSAWEPISEEIEAISLGGKSV